MAFPHPITAARTVSALHRIPSCPISKIADWTPNSHIQQTILMVSNPMSRLFMNVFFMDDFSQACMDLFIVFRDMREVTMNTAFDVFRFADIFKVAAALIPLEIEWAITKQTIEPFGVAAFMAWKGGTIHVPEKAITIFHDQTPLRDCAS